MAVEQAEEQQNDPRLHVPAALALHSQRNKPAPTLSAPRCDVWEKTKTHFTKVGHVVTPVDAKVKRSFWDNEVKVYCTGHMQVGWPLPQRALQQDEDGVRLWASCVPADQTDPIQTWRRRRPGKTTTTTTTRVTVEMLATRRTNCLLWNLWQPPVNKRSPCWPQILSWVTATIYVGIFLHPCCN